MWRGASQSRQGVWGPGAPDGGEDVKKGTGLEVTVLCGRGVGRQAEGVMAEAF